MNAPISITYHNIRSEFNIAVVDAVTDEIIPKKKSLNK
jgi:hypothetical protein